MHLTIDNISYPVFIEKKKTTKNTYIRVKKDLTIYVTTNTFSSDRSILKLLEEKESQILKMIQSQETKNQNNTDFHYLGKRYEVIYTNTEGVLLGSNKVFIHKEEDISKFYKKEAKKLFLLHLDKIYNRFSRDIPYPSLRIRKMTSRWGVCNTRLNIITLNLELMKRETKYLDYVIVHELSHLVYANHSSLFWKVVEENYPDYKKVRNEMKEF